MPTYVGMICRNDYQVIINVDCNFVSDQSINTLPRRSVVSYRTTSQQLWPRSLVARAPTFGAYDGVDSYVLESYTEFQLAAQLYSALKEGNASEWSSRMTSMDNATKNAGALAFFQHTLPPLHSHYRIRVHTVSLIQSVQNRVNYTYK